MPVSRDKSSSTLLAFSSARPRHRVVPGVPPPSHAAWDDEPAPTPAAVPLSGRERERALLDAWREAHWALRMKLQDVTRLQPGLDVDRCYDEARRCDNLLNDFYQARTEVLARQVRNLLDGREPPAMPTESLSTPDTVLSGEPKHVSVIERALVARFRSMSPEARAELLRVAVRLTSPATGGQAER